jgi:hypothetical protein
MSKVLNSRGVPIVLNAQERQNAEYNTRRIKNALGYEINITTLSTILKKVAEQKFFQVAPADYLPVKVGEGSWSMNIVKYRSFIVGDDFQTGLINTGSNNDRLAAVDAGVDSVTSPVFNWAKSIHWSIPDLALAAKSGNWDLVTEKEKARKKNWDLGIQKASFLGLGQSGAYGLLNQPSVTVSSLMSKAISAMSTTELKAFCYAVLNEYRANCQRTVMPTHFIIPESDYLGLAAPASADFPIKSVLAVLEETFQVMTGNKGFKILPLAYGDTAYNALGKQCYVMLNYDEDAIAMQIPVDYTNTLANSLDNFMFQNAGYGQFGPVVAYRPREILYFQF